MEPIWKGKQTNKTSNTCTSDKGKQTNKQTSGGGMCRGTDAGGSAELCNMWSLIHNASEYAEELQRCIGDASEKHRVRYAGSYSDIGILLLHAESCRFWVQLQLRSLFFFFGIFVQTSHCRQDNNLLHDLFVEPNSRAGICYHNCPKFCLYSIMQNPEIILRG